MVVRFARHKRRRARPPSPLERRIATLSTRSRVLDMSSSLLASAAASAAAASSSSRSSGARAATRRASASSRVSRSRRPLARRAVSGAADASATVASQADFDALWSWLASEGVDVSNARPAPVDLAPGGRGWGLVAAKDLGGNETVLSVPKSLWMTQETALASPVGPHCDGQAPWVALALQLLHERSLGEASRWAPYVATLPAALDAPLFWSAEEIGELAGTQLLANAAGYDAYVRGTWAQLKSDVFDANPDVFPESRFGESDLVWAFGILRSRALPPVDQGDAIALVPGLDLANHSGLSSQTWTLNSGGLGSVFGGAGAGPSLLFRTEQGAAGRVAAGDEIFVNYGPAKIDSQFALDFGFTDAFCARPGYVLGPVAVPDDDPNRFDKEDVLEVAGLLAAPAFVIRAFEDPPPELRVFMRLLNLKGEDAFLLEAIFRQECWGLISEPVSETNERDACATMISGCEEALGGYPTRVEDDRAVAEDADAAPRARLAARVRMGEKQALTEALGFYAGVESRLDAMEYYQERRLRSLNLLDKDGNSTYDPFQDTMA